MKRLFGALLVLSMVAGLAACSSSSTTPSSSVAPETQANTEAAGTEAAETEAPETEAAVQQKYEYNVGASNPSGQSYRWVVPVCELVNKYSDFVTLNPITTTGSVENVNLLYSGEAPLGIGPVNTVNLAINGLGDWEGNALDASQIRFVYAYMPDGFYVAVPENSDIETVADLKGKTLGFGEVGSGTYTGTITALKALGYTEEDFDIQNVSMADGCTGVAEGWIDAVPSYGSYTISAISEMQAGPAGLKIIAPTEEEIEMALAANPIYSRKTVESAYPGIDTFETFGGTTALFCRADVPDEVTYEIAKIINEHLDELTLSFELGAYSAIENSVDAVSIVETAGGTLEYMKDLGLK